MFHTAEIDFIVPPKIVTGTLKDRKYDCWAARFVSKLDSLLHAHIDVTPTLWKFHLPHCELYRTHKLGTNAICAKRAGGQMATSRGLSGGILYVDFPERPSCATSRWLLMSRSIVLCLTNPRSMLLLRRWVRWRRQGRWYWPRGRRGRWPRAPVCFGSGRMFRRRWGRRFGGGHEAPIGGHFASGRGPRGRRGQGGHPV